ncbi:sulfatase-like hydrolase/transferase [Candidatus Bathyarchaeota archaeon]|nr:sulfatase-like hydrolase/transferase [Candidatus Bathyarchaeota archaeon]
MYEDVDIELPKVRIPQDQQDPHSERLMKVCDLWDADFTDDQVKRARRAYYGSVSYVDDCVGRILETLRRCKLDDNTIVVFSGDHGDMLGERGLWYKMSFFENSARVPLFVHHPHQFEPRRVKENVSTLDILPTMCDLVGSKPLADVPLDGKSLWPHLANTGKGHDKIYCEYTGEGTIAPLVMIKDGPWKYIYCPLDGTQLFNLADDPLELVNLAKSLGKTGGARTEGGAEAERRLAEFSKECGERWDFEALTREVVLSQRKRRLVWAALRKGRYESWDYNPIDDGREK